MMKILLTLDRRQSRKYLITLFTKSLVSEVKDLVAAQDYTGAMNLVYKEGLLDREVLDEELPALKADLILSDCSASWDMVK